MFQPTGLSPTTIYGGQICEECFAHLVPLLSTLRQPRDTHILYDGGYSRMHWIIPWPTTRKILCMFERAPRSEPFPCWRSERDALLATWKLFKGERELGSLEDWLMKSQKSWIICWFWVWDASNKNQYLSAVLDKMIEYFIYLWIWYN